MKILLFTPNFLPSLGGAERMADTITRHLIGRGHDVRVLCQWARGQRREIELPYPVHRYRRPPKLNLWPELLTRPLRRLHGTWPFDVVLAFYAYPTGYAATRVKQRLGCKVVITPRGGDLYPSYHGRGKWRVRRTIAAGYRQADRIVSISQWLTERIREETAPGGAALPPIDQVPNGLDLAQFDHDLAESRAHPPTPVPVTAPYLLQLSRLHPVKQHHVVIDAVAAARDLFEARGLRLAVAGDGPAQDAIRAQVERLGLGECVHLLGRRTGREKAWLLAHAAGFVTASREEGLPNAVVEAMAAGLPVVASDIGPHRELIEDRGWGFLFPVGDAAALAEAWRQWDRADPAAMRCAALNLRDDYTLERMIDGYESALRAAVATSGV